MSRRKRRTQRNNKMKIGAAAVGVAVCTLAFTTIAVNSMNVVTPNEHGCFEGTEQSETLVLVDVSGRWNAEQGRSLRRYFDGLYDGLSFNEALSFYTSEGDMIGSVMTPRFHVCGQAEHPDELKAINAESGNAGYLKKQKQRVYEKVLAPQLDALLSDRPDTPRLQRHQSPVLEMIADLSRKNMKHGNRFVIVSDLIQNSDSARFCTVKGDMPRFSAFKMREIYRHLKPESLEGIKIDLLMLQRSGYGHKDILPYCRSEGELRSWWVDYFESNGASANVIRIRHGYAG